VWGVRGTSRLVAGSWKSRAGGSCRETGSSQRTSTHLCYTRPTLAGFPAACDQSDGSPRSPCNLHAALHRNCRLTGATHGGWSTPKILRLLALYLRKGRNGPCFAFRPSDFPCAYAGSDGCPVFKRETSPVKWCGLYTGAAVRGRSVPLEEVHLAEIQA
jgi:hypothetical protein